jgi:hypothetical protein
MKLTFFLGCVQVVGFAVLHPPYYYKLWFRANGWGGLKGARIAEKGGPAAKLDRSIWQANVKMERLLRKWQCSYNGLTREASHMGISRGVVMKVEYQAVLWRIKWENGQRERG